MAIIVQKFGGTSVSSLERRSSVMDKIISAKDKGYDVVVVVSAMGRKGDPYATDTFICLLQETGVCPDPRTKDLMTSCGETISASLLAHSLRQRGVDAVALTGFQAGIVTDKQFSNAEIIEMNPQRIKGYLEKGDVVVVAGFQGWTEDGDITTLGRGGSDTSAIALGGALKAELVEIYTDVPGVALTDPRILPDTPYLNSIDFDYMYVLARAGAKVIHPRAVRTAISHNMPFTIRSTFKDDIGTVIGRPGKSVRGLYGIALLNGIAILEVDSTESEEALKKLAMDELFYSCKDGKCRLAVACRQYNDTQCTADIKHVISEECSLMTLVWDSGSGISADYVNKVLSKKAIKIAGHFTLPSGGAWAVPSNQGGEAVKLVYAAIQ